MKGEISRKETLVSKEKECRTQVTESNASEKVCLGDDASQAELNKAQSEGKVGNLRGVDENQPVVLQEILNDVRIAQQGSGVRKDVIGKNCLHSAESSRNVEEDEEISPLAIIPFGMMQSLESLSLKRKEEWEGDIRSDKRGKDSDGNYWPVNMAPVDLGVQVVDANVRAPEQCTGTHRKSIKVKKKRGWMMVWWRWQSRCPLIQLQVAVVAGP